MTVDNAQVTNNDHPIASQYTPEQSQALSAFQSFARQAQSRTFDPADASRLIYFAALDGTGSDRRNSSVPETNVSRIEQAVKNELSAYGGGATL